MKMKKKIERNHKNYQVIHSNTFLRKVLLDTVVKTYGLFPEETPLPGIPKKVLIKQVKFERDIDGK